jgi:hypothetical protein
MKIPVNNYIFLKEIPEKTEDGDGEMMDDDYKLLAFKPQGSVKRGVDNQWKEYFATFDAGDLFGTTKKGERDWRVIVEDCMVQDIASDQKAIKAQYIASIEEVE